MRPSRLEAVEARRRNLRMIFIGIIVVTLPFYCAGALLWGTAPRNLPQTATAPATTPPPSVTVPGQPTITSFPITVVVPTLGFPTVDVPPPTAFLPSAIPATRFITATPTIFIPTATTPPPPPTFAAPPTSALPTDYVPLPFDTPTTP